MKIQTMSIVCGTTECNAHCPFCISKTTPQQGISDKPSNLREMVEWNLNLPKVNYRNLGVACRIAEKGGATTCLITGKGEPTLYPDLITKYITEVSPYFPLIELQTNGMLIEKLATPSEPPSHLPLEMRGNCLSDLEKWYKLGLTTIALSAVETGYANKKVYGDDYPELSGTIKKIHSVGLSVRLSMMMLKKYIDSPKQVERLIGFCKENKVEQLTIRPIDAPANVDTPVTRWIADHTLSDEQADDIKNFMIERATPVLKLPHGATIYDLDGQNVCYANCLTTNQSSDNMRQIIYFPDGTIGYDWKYAGARLL